MDTIETIRKLLGDLSELVEELDEQLEVLEGELDE